MPAGHPLVLPRENGRGADPSSVTRILNQFLRSVIDALEEWLVFEGAS